MAFRASALTLWQQNLPFLLGFPVKGMSCTEWSYMSLPIYPDAKTFLTQTEIQLQLLFLVI